MFHGTFARVAAGVVARRACGYKWRAPYRIGRAALDYVHYPEARYRAHRDAIDDAVRRVLEGGRYILGEEVRGLEGELASYVDVDHGVGVASGTDALRLALAAVGVSRGNEVITVAHTAVATVAAIVQLGATPVFVDIDDASFLIDLDAVTSSITPKTRAVVPVHLYGRAVDVAELRRRVGSSEVAIVEDCAQAIGARFHGAPVGSLGDAASFSFYPTKNLGAFGDGGMVTTSSAEVAAAVRSAREYGWQERFVSSESGWNSRLDEIQAAILRVLLSHLTKENVRRAELAAIYREVLADAPLVLPAEDEPGSHVHHQFVVRSARRDDLRARLEKRGVPAQVHYPVPVHRQPAYVDCCGGIVLPKTDRAAAEVLSLPLHPHLDDADVREIARTVAEVAAH